MRKRRKIGALRGANETRVPSRANLWRKCSNSHTTPACVAVAAPLSSSTLPSFSSRKNASLYAATKLRNRGKRKKWTPEEDYLSPSRSVIMRNCSVFIDGSVWLSVKFIVTWALCCLILIFLANWYSAEFLVWWKLYFRTFSRYHILIDYPSSIHSKFFSLVARKREIYDMMLY